jgi:hypothetical protein
MFGGAELSAWGGAGILRSIWMGTQTIVYRCKARYMVLYQGSFGEEGLRC